MVRKFYLRDEQTERRRQFRIIPEAELSFLNASCLRDQAFVEHPCDNDCETDDEQATNAANSLIKEL